MPLLVRSADAEMVELVTRGGSCRFHEFPRFPVILGHALVANHQAAKETFLIEGDHHLAAVHFASTVNRAGAGGVLAILFGERPACHPHPRMELVVVMDSSGPGRVEVGLNHHPHVLAVVFEEQMLNLTNVGKTDVIGVGRPVALHLSEIERHLGHAPGISPALDQSFHSGRINPAVTTVAGPLAPDRASDGVRNNRSNLAIIELRRPAPHPGDPGQIRAGWHFTPGLCCTTCLILPHFQIGVVLHEGIAALSGERIRIVNEVCVCF